MRAIRTYGLTRGTAHHAPQKLCFGGCPAAGCPKGAQAGARSRGVRLYKTFGFLFSAVVLSLRASAAPLTVAVGWDTGGVTPAQLLAHADQFAEMPYDGVVFRLIIDGSDQANPIYCNPLVDAKAWSREDMSARFGDDCRKIAQRINHQALISPENRAKFRACFGVGGAFYLDMFTNPPGAWYKPPIAGRRLNTFLDRYEDAAASSEIIWIYGEKHSHVNWSGIKVAKGYESAYTNGTWEAALPGYAKELRILRDPRRELLPRLKALKAAGKAPNLAGEPVADDKGLNYRMKIGGAKFGEWYAVAVEMKSDHPEASITLKAGDTSIWDRGTAPFAFSAPDEKGMRRAVAFQRIWGSADGFEVNCGYNDYFPTKPQNLKVGVYRVFDPGVSP